MSRRSVALNSLRSRLDPSDRRDTLIAWSGTTWSDEGLDDLARRVDTGFDRVDADIRELRAEVRDTRAELGAELGALRVTMIRVGGAMMAAMTAGFLSVIAAVLLRGA